MIIKHIEFIVAVFVVLLYSSSSFFLIRFFLVFEKEIYIQYSEKIKQKNI